MPIKKNMELFLTQFKSNQTLDAAKSLCQTLTMSKISVLEKRNVYKELFNIVNDHSIEAMINLWAVASMIEDDLSVSQKVLAVRGFIEDYKVKVEWIEDWIKTVWKLKKTPSEFLNFIAIDLRNIQGLSKGLKEMLFEELEE
ncbi:MAG: hypothetical protein GF353_28885 [Candidatus Lokiarchaeota archaeon]|nr:hypothetical protein [Candidatus Lokiarchaeota archaeon]